MKKNLFYFLSHVAAFTIGIYATTEIRFGGSIELYRWIITISCLVLFVIAYHVLLFQERREEKHEVSELTYQDAEAHVFRSIARGSGQLVWQYFYIDRDGKNQHSQFYGTRKQAVEAYIIRPHDERTEDPE
jgi:hypothetical protein